MKKDETSSKEIAISLRAVGEKLGEKISKHFRVSCSTVEKDMIEGLPMISDSSASCAVKSRWKFFHETNQNIAAASDDGDGGDEMFLKLPIHVA